MTSKLIFGNKITFSWGTPAKMKYLAEDLWAYDDKDQLACLILHVYSHDAAGSAVLKAPPEVLTLCKPETPVGRFRRDSLEQPQPEDPLHHLVYRNNLVTVYPAGPPGEPLHVHQPSPGLFVLTASRQVRYVVITCLDSFELQVTSTNECVALADLSETLREDVLSLFADDWVHNDTDELLPAMLRKWEPKVAARRDEMPEPLIARVEDILQFWREMAED